ncbi:MAG: CCA tRNA nucleotidyltransferase (EC [uncultured Paraburkholderia sp.]|nr:MAG: CCA tRNA nucleotidyltransferase (EC [uncultured Paraburkholderia sp.]CAH2922729.1 MAG: CCA tRNA nucleotidyltransferase (EC [uncultured Paraburkholderia sp.]
MKLLIGDKNYSSWSMRPWLLFKHFGIPFEEVLIHLNQPDTNAKVLAYAPTGPGKIPCLIDDNGSAIWDSLAIAKTLAERFPQHALWPRDAAARSHARSVSAEMHSGFGALRSNMWMNIRASFPGKNAKPEALADIARIESIWRNCLETYGGPFLFGEFGIADAMYGAGRHALPHVATGFVRRLRGVRGAREQRARGQGVDRRLAERNLRHRLSRRMPMNIYAVGGAIRDELLGVPVQDRDYVVVGATPEQMVAQGYRPVGKDFPVFLHPQTHEEYALARTERKTAAGYHGFQFFYAPDVTLEEDLARRDLTINAMAREVRPDGELTGPVIDPFKGQGDLQARLFRHVSDAFLEDPVRILRIARFAARFVDFTVALETMALMKKMVADGEVDALVAERVWQEVSRGLMEKKPSRMFDVLRECGALARILPEIDALFGVPQRADYHPEVDTGLHVMMVVDHAAQQGYALPVRFAALTHDLGKATTPADVLPKHIGHEERSVDLLKRLAERLRVPNDCRDLGLLVAREHGNIHRVMEMGAAALVRLLERSDAIRKPARFAKALQACEADTRGRLGFEAREYPQAERLRVALVAARGVDTGAVAKRLADAPAGIKDAVHQERVKAVEAALQ